MITEWLVTDVTAVGDGSFGLTMRYIKVEQNQHLSEYFCDRLLFDSDNFI